LFRLGHGGSGRKRDDGDGETQGKEVGRQMGRDGVFLLRESGKLMVGMMMFATLFFWFRR
jgi:hypothetical protein